jgi:nickel-dependent lactate racemase
MKHVEILTSSWYKDEEVSLEFPDAWEIDVFRLPQRSVLEDEEITEAFHTPTGTPRISEIARKKRSAAILVDDLSRPTPAHALLPYVLKELESGGISRDNVLIIIAFGCHRQLSRWELEQKLGPGIVGQIEAICHDAQGDLVDLGTSSRGTPITVNRFALECDMRIGIGGVYPHGGPAWGGGA